MSITQTMNQANNNNTDDAVEAAYTTAILRSLKFAGVQFLRYYTVDACNNLRTKAKLVDRLLQENASLNNQVSIAEVCYAGLPSYADMMVEGTGMNAKNVLIVQPDLGSFRILPYAPKSAVVFGNSIDQFTNEPSPLCTRSLLGRVIENAREEHNIKFVSETRRESILFLIRRKFHWIFPIQQKSSPLSFCCLKN